MPEINIIPPPETLNILIVIKFHVYYRTIDNSIKKLLQDSSLLKLQAILIDHLLTLLHAISSFSLRCGHTLGSVLIFLSNQDETLQSISHIELLSRGQMDKVV